MISASWTSTLRLIRSASLPQIGVETVVASSVAVTTQVYAVWSPLRSAMMIGSDVDTTVPARIDTNMPMRRPDIAWSTSRWWRFASSASVGSLEVRECVVAMGLLLVDSGQLYAIVDPSQLFPRRRAEFNRVDGCRAERDH